MSTPYNTGPCTVETLLRSNLQTSDDISVLTKFYHSVVDANTHRVNIAMTRNSEVVTYVQDGSTTVACDLSDIATNECEVDYRVEILSINGTIADQKTGKITFKSECY